MLTVNCKLHIRVNYKELNNVLGFFVKTNPFFVNILISYLHYGLYATFNLM